MLTKTMMFIQWDLVRSGQLKLVDDGESESDAKEIELSCVLGRSLRINKLNRDVDES